MAGTLITFAIKVIKGYLIRTKRKGVSDADTPFVLYDCNYTYSSPFSFSSFHLPSRMGINV